MLELMAVSSSAKVLIIVAQVLFILVAVLISFAILLQEGKGGGLSALAGGSSQQVIGTSNPLRRITIIFAVAFFGIAIFLARAMSEKGLKKKAPEPGMERSDKPGDDQAGDKTAPVERRDPE